MTNTISEIEVRNSEIEIRDDFGTEQMCIYDPLNNVGIQVDLTDSQIRKLIVALSLSLLNIQEKEDVIGVR